MATVRRARMRDDKLDDEARTDMDVPLSDLLVALGIAALIGAAGGWVYAGILGSKRRDRCRARREVD